MNTTELLTQIANEELGVETLETRGSDRLDFHAVSVRELKAALEQAFKAGREYKEEAPAVPTINIPLSTTFTPEDFKGLPLPVEKKRGRGPKVIELRGLKYKDRVRGGTKYEGSVAENTNADVIVGESIRIFGSMHGREYDKTFKVGDIVVTGSYNLIYTGIITQITDRNVTVKENNRSSQSRMDLVTFTNRNYDFDLEHIRNHNANWND